VKILVVAVLVAVPDQHRGRRRGRWNRRTRGRRRRRRRRRGRHSLVPGPDDGAARCVLGRLRLQFRLAVVLLEDPAGLPVALVVQRLEGEVAVLAVDFFGGPGRRGGPAAAA
jgi:hypothetical protein